MNVSKEGQTARAVFVMTALVLLRDETGQDLIEYALVACLIALGAVASMKSIGSKLASSFTGISSSVTSAI